MYHYTCTFLCSTFYSLLNMSKNFIQFALAFSFIKWETPINSS